MEVNKDEFLVKLRMLEKRETVFFFGYANSYVRCMLENIIFDARGSAQCLWLCLLLLQEFKLLVCTNVQAFLLTIIVPRNILDSIKNPYMNNNIFPRLSLRLGVGIAEGL